MTTVISILMDRDGLDYFEASEIAEDIYSKSHDWSSLVTALRAYHIDPVELGLIESPLLSEIGDHNGREKESL